MGKVMFLHVSVHGGRYPSPMFFPGVSSPDWGGVLQSWLEEGSPVLTMGVPQSHAGVTQDGVFPNQDRNGYPLGLRYPPARIELPPTGTQVPPVGTGLPPWPGVGYSAQAGQDSGTPPPKIEQQSKYLPCGGQYASCGPQSSAAVLAVLS